MLDALGDELGVDFVRERFERLDELLFHEARVDVAHEAHIELHVVGPQMDDLVEPGIARSHIVDGDETSEIHEVFHRVHEEREIIDRVGLGDLEHDLLGREINPVENIDEVLALEARVSDRKRQGVDEQFVLARELRATHSRPLGPCAGTGDRARKEGQPFGQHRKELTGCETPYWPARGRAPRSHEVPWRPNPRSAERRS